MYRIKALFAVVATCISLALPHSAQANLLANPGFESGASWTPWSGANIETWAARTGANGLAFYGWTTGGGAYQDVFASGASNYTFSIFGFRDTNFTVGGVVLKLEFINAASGMVSELWGSVPVSQSTNAWALYSVTGISPTGTVRVRAVLAFSGLAGTGGGFKWDDGTLTSVTAIPPICYVSPTGTHSHPFSSWATAATNIQDAVNAVQNSGLVLVGTGLYAPVAQVVVTNGITIRGANGPTNTTVTGSGVHRGFFIDHPNAILDGFTVTNGWAAAGADSNAYGGGVWCRGGTLTNCVITGNRLGRPGANPWTCLGAGAYLESGRATRCDFVGNAIQGGQAVNGPLSSGYGLGGGLCSVKSAVDGCSLKGNSVIGGYGNMGYFGGSAYGGGLYATATSTVRNCMIEQNLTEGGWGTGHGHGSAYGAGLFCTTGSVAEFCNIVSNSARGPNGDPTYSTGSGVGGGAFCDYGGVIQFSRITDNRALGLDGYYGGSGFAGGVWVETNSLVQSCLIVRNAAIGGSGSGNLSAPGHAIGGGAAGRGKLRNCTVADNRCTAGSGYYGNTDSQGGGVYGLDAFTCENTILYFNTATNYPNIYTNTGSAVFSHSCTTPNPGGSGNVTTDPAFVNRASGDYHLTNGSPCLNVGDNATAGGLFDVDGNPRIANGTVDVGAYEAPSAVVNLLSNPSFEAGAGESAPGWTLWDNAQLESWAARSGTNGLAFYGWTSGGGAYQDIDSGGFSNYTLTVHGFRDAQFDFYNYYVQVRLEFLDADYGVIDFLQQVVRGTNQWETYTLSAPSPRHTAHVRAVLSFSGAPGSGGSFKWDDIELTSTPFTPVPDIHYASQAGTMIYPYTNWATASRSIAAAVKAAHAGDTILVDNGQFNTPSQIDVDVAVHIRSVNGPTNSTVNGSGSFRGFYVTDPGAVIEGLTITNCRSSLVGSNNFGAGVCMLNGGTLLNSIVSGNTATGHVSGGYGYARGGGIYCAVTGRIENCRVAGNTVIGGESSGGGIYCVGNVVVTNCDVSRNTSKGGTHWFYYGQCGFGGGVMALNGARVESCRITNNVAEGNSNMYPGGGVGAGVYCASATVSRCVIAGNISISGNYSSRGDSGATGGGAYVGNGGRLENSLVANNIATGIYMYADAYGGGVLAYGSAEVRSCTIVGNRVYPGQGADYGGGGGLYAMYGPVIRNTIIHGNSAGSRGYDNWYAFSGVAMSYCCTTPGTNGPGNIAADPRLSNIAAGDAHLLADSPCIDRGDNATSPALDFDGNPRPLDGNSDTFARADIGAYEAPANTTTPNLLLNGTFENPSAWVFIDDAREESWATRSGTNGLAMYGWTDGGIVWQDIPAAGISNYTFTAWGLRDPDFSSGLAVEMKIEFLGASLTPLAVTQKFMTGTAAWASFSISGISPPDTEVVRVVLAFAGSTGAGGAFKWDDAVLLSSEATFNAHYVAAGGGNIYPFTNWAGAATNLQAAIDAAEAADTILVSNGTYMGETVVNKSLNIRGLGDVRLTGKAAYPFTNQVRALSVNAGCLLDLRNVTILNGFNHMGGGIYNQGTLVLKDSTVISNVANLLYGNGGGIYNGGTATLQRCSISLNVAHGEGTPGSGTGYGAGIYCANGSLLVITDCALVGNRAYGTGNYNGRDGGSGYGGAIYNDGGTVTLINTTLASNSAAGAWAGYNGGHGYGGGIYTRGSVTLRSCTLADNRAQQGGATMGGPYVGEGGGIYIADDAPAATIRNTILARNTASTAGPDYRGTLDAIGQNLIGTDPKLAGLGMNGGPTLTMALLYGSSAIDQGSSDGVPSTDQRGTPRSIDGDFNGNPQFDIGAFEYDPQVADSDCDSVSDYSEVIVHHSNPSNGDSDEDGVGDGAEIIAGTSPTNDASLLAMESGGTADWNGEGIVIRWQSADGRYYQLMRATNLTSGFTTSWSNIQATPPVNTFTDTTATASSPYYYKVKVE